jgi:hypothetical protein
VPVGGAFKPGPRVGTGTFRPRHRVDLPSFPVLLLPQMLDRQGIRAFGGPWCRFHPEVAPGAQHIPSALGFDVLPQLTGAAVHFVPGEPRGHRVIGGHVGDDVLGQLGFGREHHLRRNPQLRTATLIIQLLGRHPDPSPGQRMPPSCRIGAIHRVHTIFDPPGAPHVLPFHPRRLGALLPLPRLIQRTNNQVPSQMFRHETPHHRHRSVGVPHGVIEQPLCPTRRRIPSMLGDRPPILPRHITHQRRDVLPGLPKRLHPGKTRPNRPCNSTRFPTARSPATIATAAASSTSCFTP